MILTDVVQEWSPEIGDPSPLGWFTVVAYFAVAILLVYHLWQCPKLYDRYLRRHAGLLVVAVLFFGFLGVNKQLDLQTLFTDIGRAVAEDQGWYEERRTVQTFFIGALLLSTIFLFALTALYLRQVLTDHWIQLLGLFLLGAFVVVRASSAHFMDVLIGLELGGVKVNWILELGGIGLVATGTILSLLRSKRELPETESW